MEVTSGFALLFQQFSALLRKNLLLSWRNRKATLLQVLSPLFFMFLIFAIDKAIKAQYSNTTYYKSVPEPPLRPSPSIPPCENKFFVKLPCYDFVWSGDRNPRIRTIVEAIMNNNPGRTIPPSKVKSFSDKAAVDEWLLNNPMHCPGALHFVERSKTIISYGLQTNSTYVQKRGKYEDPTFAFQLPLQLAAEREIARNLIGDSNFSWNVFLREFAHPATAPFSTVSSVGPTFFLAIAMFNFVLQMSSLVTEKELKLRQAMTMMGLYDSAYWLSWLIWEAFITLLSSLLVVLFGMMFQFRFFLKNDFLVVFFVFFLFELSMTGLAFMLSAFISKSSSATTVGFSIFIVGFVTQLVIQAGFPYSDSISKTFRIIWSFFPPNPFAQALHILSEAVSTSEDHGIRWSKRGQCGPEDEGCVITINDIYQWLLATFVLWFVLAIYFDNIIPNASGVRKSMLYFLNPNYWMGRGGQNVKEGGVCSCCIVSVPRQEHVTPDDQDVLEEQNTVKRQITEGVVDANVAVQIRGLAKTYPGACNIGCCCKCKRIKPYNAVKDLWVNFERDQLFCLLGPNGAGKTTVINCLTGITPATDGDALIYGHSIRSSTGMSNIQKLIGVCPQFDILWDALSGEEHLQLFATIKGLTPSSINLITQTSLAEVRLTDSAKVRAGSYSGGMKRRLSVAISLIGDPKLVVLDEPTTGMDPITRRHVWDIIENAKRGRAIVLTTHSMEEADILSDRIGIMAKGKLCCIGTAIRLKSRFGTGFIANISFYGNNVESRTDNRDAVSTVHHEAVKQFFKNHLDVVPKEENNNFITFVIPHDKEGLLTNFFAELQDREEEFGISDIQLGLTTLEEVFLNIAKQAELESAAADGTLVTLTLTSGESVQIPIGARFVGIPETESEEYPTGVMVEVYWEQDESGALCISGHSQKVPVPSGVRLSSSASARHRRNSRRSGSVHGVIIDPSQVSSVRFQ
ncbi:ABC transporter A family member 2-like [Arachis stenosperma]|uniref:ABC transporter A family member 2-like n=1 Tax=Arachis stenosperma TaxID=217475 RepID=UPI0025ACB5CE|nr:ABC transporter A family member 2-like [Arachis stenosperma]